MPYATLYKNLIQSEITTSKSKIRVRKLYKIIGYEYADGEVKQFRGSNAVLIFVLGIFRKKVYCLLTTHFIKVCKNLKKNPNIINKYMVTEKNNDRIKYIYTLKDGISNVKGGIDILTEMNYPKEIIHNTKNNK